MKIVIPVKPLSVNACWQGRRFKTKLYKQYEKDIMTVCKRCPLPLFGKLQATYRFYIKNDKMTDGDNLVKALQDILVKLEYICDDRYIMRYIIEKYHSTAADEHIEVEYEEMGQ